MTKRNITQRRRRKIKLKYKQKGGMDAAAKSGPPPAPSGVHQRQHGTNFVTVEVMVAALTHLREEVFAAVTAAGGASHELLNKEGSAAGLGLVAIEHFVERVRGATLGAAEELPSPAPAPAPPVFDAVVVAGTPTSGKGPPPGDGGEAHLDDPRGGLNYKIDLLAKIILMDLSGAMDGKLYGPNILRQFPDNWIEFYTKYLERPRPRGGGHPPGGGGLSPNTNLTRGEIAQFTESSVIGFTNEERARAPIPGRAEPWGGDLSRLGAQKHGLTESGKTVIDINEGGRIKYTSTGTARGGKARLVPELY